jgi:hypothetical protein
VPSSLNSTPVGGPTPKKNRGGGRDGREGGKVLGASGDGRMDCRRREGAPAQGGSTDAGKVARAGSEEGGREAGGEGEGVG